VHRGKSKCPHAIKIGLCTRDKINTRLKNLQTGSVDKLRVLGVVRGASAERKFHRRFKGFHMRGEFYRPAPEIPKLIETLVQVQRLVVRFERLAPTTCIKSR
jgi:hypothetical protein